MKSWLAGLPLWVMAHTFWWVITHRAYLYALNPPPYVNNYALNAILTHQVFQYYIYTVYSTYSYDMYMVVSYQYVYIVHQ